jgi:hypothetical protein
MGKHGDSQRRPDLFTQKETQMEQRTRHRSWQTACRHLTRQGFERHPVTGLWHNRAKRLRARFETNVPPYYIEVVYTRY